MQQDDTFTRTYGAAHFGLAFDDNADQVGMFRSVEGGGIKTEVMTYQQGATYERWRQLGKPKFEDLKVQVGMSMSEPFYDWISNFFSGTVVRKSGAIMAADFFYQERARRSFSEAIISEITFPELKGGDTSPVYMTVGIAVEDMVYAMGDGHTLAPPQGSGEVEQMNWTASNFEFTIDGYDSSLFRVQKVDSFTVKQQVIEYHAGNRRSPIKCPSQIDFPPLVITLPESDCQALVDHFHQRAVNGEVPGNNRFSGHIQTRDSSDNPLFLINFYNADISSVTPDKQDASSTDVKMVRLELYTEWMDFTYEG